MLNWSEHTSKSCKDENVKVDVWTHEDGQIRNENIKEKVMIIPIERKFQETSLRW